jgi:hypothetical protein
MSRPRGRPRLNREVVTIAIGTLHLVTGEDDDLIAFFKSLPVGKRRVGLKSALRSGIKGVVVQDLRDDSDLEDAATEFLR